MRISINGESREVAGGATVADLVQQLGLERSRLAVEHNGKIVPVADRPRAALSDGDVLELVTFVGGG